jgi:hypothetical protein
MVREAQIINPQIRRLLGVAADARPDDGDEQGVPGGEVPEA